MQVPDAMSPGKEQERYSLSSKSSASQLIWTAGSARARPRCKRKYMPYFATGSHKSLTDKVTNKTQPLFNFTSMSKLIGVTASVCVLKNYVHVRVHWWLRE